ncbi:unnamed protein product [Hymenolepis diminuta]|uniref:Uncharacterized protein n=1 Tax=Hymenolepis diminuta TaxID=6216 RepID=A0A564YZN0_HYMDI|nr:unnamed protein product [Hymenolepis diminuta]
MSEDSSNGDSIELPNEFQAKATLEFQTTPNSENEITFPLKTCESFLIYSGSRPWSFGRHAMFSYDDQCFFLRILECKKCLIRRLYHKLAARELSAGNTTDLVSEPLKTKRHFHSITRLLRVIKSIDLLIKNTKPHHEKLQIGRMVCKEHVIDAYEYVIRAADDNVHHLNLQGIGSSPPAKWVKKILPPGQTELYFVGSGWKRREIQFAVLRDIANKPLTLSPKKKYSKAVRDANKRWTKGYSNLESVKVEQKEGGKSVRFARGSGLVKEHLLIHHAEAAKILRKDKTWVIESMHRRQVECEEGEYKKMCEYNLRGIFKKSLHAEEEKEEDKGEGEKENIGEENVESISFENEFTSSDSEQQEDNDDDSSESENPESHDEDSQEDSDDEFDDF